MVKLGGFIGLNEGTFVMGKPPDEFLTFIQRTMGGVEFLSPEEWCSLLEASQLTDIVVEVNQPNSVQQRRDELQGMDAQDWLQRI